MGDKVLLTGGTGYIGSHTAYALMDEGYSVVLLDNLSNSARDFAPKGASFVEGDAGDQRLVESVIAEHSVSAVIHFAGSIVVPESVENPMEYYENNVINSHRLIAACLRQGVKHFVFSSSAAVYGTPAKIPIVENDPTRPINPYGWSKLMVEQMLRDVSAIGRLRFVALRYFNVAGADPMERTGQVGKTVTHLVKVAAQVAVGLRPGITVFGDDYDTPDGTCIRDYVHVTDLATAHLAALRHLQGGGASDLLNCGYGKGVSVKEVLAAVEEAIGQKIETVIGPRRAGDPPALVADTTRIGRTLDWTPELDDLGEIVQSAINWERRLAGAGIPALSRTRLAKP